jgi:integrase
MTVYKRNGSKNYYCEFQIDGKVYVRSTGTPNKNLARRFEHNFRESIYRQQRLGELPSISIQDAIHLYQKSQKPRVVERNLIAQIRALETQFPRVLKLSALLEDLSTPDMEKLRLLRVQDGVSDGTIQQLFVLVKGMIACAKASGFAVPSQLVLPKIKLRNARDRVLSDEEEQRLLNELLSSRSSDGYDLVVLLLDTAARLNEIQQLKWSDIDVDAGEIRLWRTKTKTESVIHLTDRAKAILTRRKNGSDSGTYVFPSKDGSVKKYTPKAVQNAFKRAGLDGFRTHDLRHHAASKLLRGGMSLYELSKLLGHSSIQMTQRYAHLELKSVADKAVDILNGLDTQKKETK